MNLQGIIVLLKGIVLFDICFFIFASPFNKILSKVSFCAAVLLWVFIKILEKGPKFYKGLIPRTILNKPLFFFLAAALISVLFSANFNLSQRVFFERYIPYALFFWLVYAVITDSERNIDYIVLSLLAMGIFLGLGAFKDYLSSLGGRPSTAFGIRVNFAAYLSMLMSFSFIVLFSKIKKIFKYLSFAGISLLWPFSILHGSRSVWITLVVSLIFVIFFVKNKLRIPVFLMVIFSVLLIPREYKERAATITDAFSQSTVETRIGLFSFAFDIFKQYPVFGAGLGTYGKMSYDGKRDIHAHNMFLEVMAEMGMVGFLAFMGIIFLFLKSFIKNLNLWRKSADRERMAATAAGAAVFTGLILNLFYSSILIGFQDALIFWLFLAIAVNNKPFDKEIGPLNQGDQR